MTQGFGAHGTSFNGDVFNTLYGRQQGCLQCDNVAPSCPSCKDTENCQFTIRTCEKCPSSFCAPKMKSVGDSPAPAPNNTGAIAGGVIGGLAAMAILTYLVWKFCIKTKRSAEAEQYADTVRSKEGFQDDAAIRQSKRTSTHTVHSIASTVLTRASNIIQIAYIPGVTNRATPTSPNVLVPPVPPIPLAHSENGSVSSPYDEQHFFMPGDLRNSTYSGISAFSDRTSYARTSYAPRSSVASTIYGKNAVVSPLPAQKGNFLKPSLVSVKSRAGSTESGDSVPAVPAVDYGKYDKPPPSPAFSIGSTFFKNASASTATQVRPQMISVSNGGPKTIEIRSKNSSANISTISETPSGDKLGTSGVTIIETPPATDQGPFADPPSSASTTPSLVGAEAERSRSRSDSDERKGNPARGRSPFGDEHVVRDN